MKKWCVLISLIALMMGSGCGSSEVTVKPDDANMVGTWVPDKSESTCASALISNATKLVLNQDGTFQAENFPKELSLGRQSNVSGHWSLSKEGNRWKLDLPWETPSTSILDGAQLIQKSGILLIEFWIDDPDLYQRLVLRKRS